MQRAPGPLTQPTAQTPSAGCGQVPPGRAQSHHHARRRRQAAQPGQARLRRHSSRRSLPACRQHCTATLAHTATGAPSRDKTEPMGSCRRPKDEALEKPLLRLQRSAAPAPGEPRSQPRRPRLRAGRGAPSWPALGGVGSPGAWAGAPPLHHTAGCHQWAVPKDAPLTYPNDAPLSAALP